jgi:N-acetylglucosaminyldiphosphoundecaprenol N-acetyl-beta-D-mannosaminyltransferase
MTAQSTPPEVSLRGARLSLIAGDQLVDRLIEDATNGRAGYVCIANVHQVTLAWGDESFRRVLDGARHVSTDSRVLELSLRALGLSYESPVTYGVDLLESLCRAAAAQGVRVGLYGGTVTVNCTLQAELCSRFPGLQLVFAEAPAFGSADELAGDGSVARIKDAGVQLLLVGLGCPKQEEWMHLTESELDCVAVGLGAAFDFVAGEKRVSPDWVRRAGLDWAWRLVSEPRRLWRRYLVGNAVWLLRLIPLIVRTRLGRPETSSLLLSPRAGVLATEADTGVSGR